MFAMYYGLETNEKLEDLEELWCSEMLDD